jgi:hypothetical protein
MHSRTSLLSRVLLSLFPLLSACTSAERADAVGDTTLPAATSAPSCWLRGATADEAATRPSPLGELRISLGGTEALLCYSRPSAKGRVVMGQLVPYGEPWRLGANEATAIHLPFAAGIGDVNVDAGTYSIYAVPTAGEWEFFVNRQAQRWGIPIDAGVTSDNVGSFKRPVTALTTPVEQLTFRWEPTGGSAGQLVMEWDKTQVTIPIERRGT